MAATPPKRPPRLSVSEQILDAGPRGGGAEALCALSSGKKGKVHFFKGDDAGTPIGSHDVFDFNGEQQSVGMVQTWNRCEQMMFTLPDKPKSLVMMDTEKGATISELSLARQQKNWGMQVSSIAPMHKFEQYKQNNVVELFGLGDGGTSVFVLNHDTRAGENVEERVIRADSCRKYKSVTFTCHAQTKAGYLAVGRTDGGVALYDAVMQSEKANCVLDGTPGPVTSIDVAADGSMLVWTTPEFVYFSCPSPSHWLKGKHDGKPAVLQLRARAADYDAMLPWDPDEGEEGEGSEPPKPHWTPVKFDATTARDEDGLREREIITYCGATQLRWNVRQARAAWQKLAEDEAAPGHYDGVATTLGASVFQHMVVNDDCDVVALEEGIVKGLRF